MKRLVLSMFMIWIVPVCVQATTIILTDGKIIETGNCDYIEEIDSKGNSQGYMECHSDKEPRLIRVPTKAIREIRNLSRNKPSDKMKFISPQKLTPSFEEMYEQIKPGMTYAEVKQIIGAGKETHRYEGITKQITYTWHGKVKAMNINFKGIPGQSDDDMIVEYKSMYKKIF